MNWTAPAALSALAAFTDNYIWLLHREEQGNTPGAAVVVDPGDAAPVLAELAARRLALSAILLTHHHPDHTGGVAALCQAFPDAHVYGPAAERISGIHTRLSGGEELKLLGLNAQALATPGHTAGHISYFLPEAPGFEPTLFCGDTLFSGGCGRLFEGTPAQMLASLEGFAALPGPTRVCCAHEYTLSNLRFARTVDPHNAALAQYEARCKVLREQGLPTLPSTIATEREINPFLRSHHAEVAAAALRHHPQAESAFAAFAALRAWKNVFA
jgi:hydroxyacylglutathione hydrolase